MRIINAFLYFNEKRHFNFRYNLLREVIDLFVVVEASHTFSGNSKKFNFKNDFFQLGYTQDQWEKDIAYCPLTFPSYIFSEKHTAWDREKYQRNYMQFICQCLKLEDDDLVIFQDADEFPDPNVLNLYKKEILKAPDYPERLLQDMYYYDHTFKATVTNSTSTLIKGRLLKHVTQLDDVMRSNLPYCPFKNGWHFSYFMDASQIREKIQSFSHQEYNNEHFCDLEMIKKRMANYEDLFDRSNEHVHNFIKIEPVNNDYLPKDIENF